MHALALLLSPKVFVLNACVGLVDLALVAYEVNLDSIAAGTQVRIHVMSWAHQPAAKIVAKTRLLQQARADYNSGRLLIDGHTPLQQRPVGALHATFGECIKAAMRPLQKKFQRGTVLVNDDGGSVRFLLPHPSVGPIELTDVAKVSFDALQVKYVTLEQRPVASEGLKPILMLLYPRMWS